MRELRLAAKLRQVDVAKALNIDQTTVSAWEVRGQKPIPALRSKLAELYGVTVDELLAPDTEAGA